MIRFPCVCGRQLHARAEDVGRTAQCPSCDAVSIIPAVGDAGPPVEDGIRADRPAGSNRGEDYRRPETRDPDPPVISAMATAAKWFGISSLCVPVMSLLGLIFGLLALREIRKSRGSLAGKGAANTGIALSCLSIFLVVALTFAVSWVRAAAAQATDRVNLMHLGLAMHISHDMNDGLPQAAAFQDRNGKPLLSWRVALLPYIEQDQLYRRFRLDEPWDSPHNLKLLPLMPKTYGRPGEKDFSSGMTHYQVFVGPGTAFEPRNLGFPPPAGSPVLGWRLADFTDPSADTILIATSATPVPWTKPDDMPFSPTGPLPRLGGHLRKGANVVLNDGKVRLLPANLSDATLRAAITRNGNDTLGSDW